MKKNKNDRFYYIYALEYHMWLCDIGLLETCDIIDIMELMGPENDG